LSGARSSLRRQIQACRANFKLARRISSLSGKFQA
jgi:hypothetical protein